MARGKHIAGSAIENLLQHIFVEYRLRIYVLLAPKLLEFVFLISRRLLELFSFHKTLPSSKFTSEGKF
jgi:hypothetical protein